MNFVKTLPIFWSLLMRDCLILKKQLKSILLESALWPLRSLVIYGFILTTIGLRPDYGVFLFIGLIASVSITRIMHGLYTILQDFEGTRFIDYEMTLPIPSWLAFLRKGITFAIKSVLLSLPVIPIGLLLLKGRLQNLNIIYYKFILIFIFISLLIGFATMWLSGWVKNLGNTASVWTRYVHTFWLFGCTMFPWKLLCSMFPFWALVNLLNPVTYVMEGLRAASLNPDSYINYWFCLFMIIVFTLIFAIHGISLLKSKLDAI